MRYPVFRSLVLCAAFALAACEPTVASRGNILDADRLAEIKPGATTREDVVQHLGSPTQVSTFDDKSWYYIGRQTKQYSFLDPEVIEQKAVKITFDDQGTVKTVDNIDVTHQARDIAPVDRQTPTYGRDDTLIQQFLGNLGHPVPKSQKQEGQ